MPDNTQKLPVAVESLERRHEVTERSPGNVLIVGGATAFLLVFSIGACALAFHLLAKSRPMQNMTPLGIIIAPNLKPLERFPKPNLSIDDDHAQRVSLLAAENARLDSYRWVDRSNGIVHIPIDRAIDLILQRGLPTRTNGVSQTDGSPLQLIQEDK